MFYRIVINEYYAYAKLITSSIVTSYKHTDLYSLAVDLSLFLWVLFKPLVYTEHRAVCVYVCLVGWLVGLFAFLLVVLFCFVLVA